VAVTLRSPPAGCPGPSAEPQRPTRLYGKLYGRQPVWGGFYAEFDPHVHVFHAADAPRTDTGWRIKVLWIVHRDQSDPVVLSAHRGDGEPVWFEIAVIGPPPATSAGLDPAHPENVAERGGWKEFPSYVYFPSAGCYTLEASWRGGRWRIGFGFGR